MRAQRRDALCWLRVLLLVEFWEHARAAALRGWLLLVALVSSCEDPQLAVPCHTVVQEDGRKTDTCHRRKPEWSCASGTCEQHRCDGAPLIACPDPCVAVCDGSSAAYRCECPGSWRKHSCVDDATDECGLLETAFDDEGALRVVGCMPVGVTPMSTCGAEDCGIAVCTEDGAACTFPGVPSDLVDDIGKPCGSGRWRCLAPGGQLVCAP